jgi:hypothetical protein
MNLSAVRIKSQQYNHDPNMKVMACPLMLRDRKSWRLSDPHLIT